MSIAIVLLVIFAVALLVPVICIAASFHSIGPAEVGLVTKRIGKKLAVGSLLALNGEAGYQADLLMPGLRFKLWPVYRVERYDWVQVPPDHVGVGHRPSRRVASHRCQVGAVQALLRQLLRHPHVPGRWRPARRAATRPATGHDGADPSRWVRGGHGHGDLRENALRSD